MGYNQDRKNPRSNCPEQVKFCSRENRVENHLLPLGPNEGQNLLYEINITFYRKSVWQLRIYPLLMLQSR